MAVMYGPEDRVIPGNTAVMQDDKPFSALSRWVVFYFTQINLTLL